MLLATRVHKLTWDTLAVAHTHTRSAYSYQYRLCPAGSELTEECFQKTPLEFDRTKQTLVWNTKKVPGADSSTPPVPADGTLRYPVPTPVFVRLSHSSGFVFVCASHFSAFVVVCASHFTAFVAVRVLHLTEFVAVRVLHFTGTCGASLYRDACLCEHFTVEQIDEGT